MSKKDKEEADPNDKPRYQGSMSDNKQCPKCNGIMMGPNMSKLQCPMCGYNTFEKDDE